MLTLQRIHSRHDDLTSGCNDKPGTGGKQPHASSEIVTEDDDINSIGDYTNLEDIDFVKPPVSPIVKNNTVEGTHVLDL